jgi:hypothetical protein
MELTHGAGLVISPGADGYPFVFNETSQDCDFRVESAANANFLLLDAAAEMLLVGGGSNTAGGAAFKVSQGNDGELTLDSTSAESNIVSYDRNGGGYHPLNLYGSNINFNPTSAAIFNEASLDADFRVESDSNDHMLFVDASANKVSIGSSSFNYGTGLTVHGNEDGGTPSSVFLRNSGTSGGSGNRIECGYVTGYGAAIRFSGNPSSYRMYGTYFERITGDGPTYATSGEFGTTGIFKSYDGAVFNESSKDVDFRVESNNNASMLFVDAANDHVSIGSSSDLGGTLNVQGSNVVLVSRVTFGTPGNAVNIRGENNVGTNTFDVYGDGDVFNTNGTYGTISDQRLKENISDTSSQWDDIKALRVVKYSLISENKASADKLGVIAQEVEAAGMNGLVKELPDLDAQGNDLGTTTKAVKYSILYMKAVKALQEAMERIETLEARITALENA